MKKYFVLILLLSVLILSNVSHAQVSIPGSSNKKSAPKTWVKTYTSANESYTAHDIHQTTDKGYVVAGSMYKNPLYPDGYLIKLDEKGNMVWQKQYGTGTNIAEEFFSVAVDSNGDIITAGKVGLSLPNLLITKTDSNGNVIFSSELPNINAYNFVEVSINRKDDFFVVGMIGGDISVIKFDSAGNIIWQKKVNLRLSDKGKSVLAMDDGGVVVAGVSNHPTFSTGDEIFLTRLDKNGALVWSNNYSKDINLQFFTPYNMDRTPKGKILVAGVLEDRNIGAGQKNFVMRVNGNTGAVEWYSTINPGVVSPYDVVYGVVATENEGAVVTGSAKAADHLWLAEFTKTGNIKWQRDYTADSFQQIGRSLTRSGDGGYVFAGIGKLYNPGTLFNRSLWAVRTDENGFSEHCYLETPVAYVQDNFINTRAVTPTISDSSVTPTNKNVTVTNDIAFEDAQCP